MFEKVSIRFGLLSFFLKSLYLGIEQPGQLLRALWIEVIVVLEKSVRGIIFPLIVDIHPPEVSQSALSRRDIV